MLSTLPNKRAMSNNPQKQHMIPADVLPNDSEDLLTCFSKGQYSSCHLYRIHLGT